MAVPRATQFIALRNLTRASHQIRKLHMTGPATSPAPVVSISRQMDSDVTVESSKRPIISTPEQSTPQPIRQFNTTRSLKAVGDTSTIDFAYLPTDIDPDLEEILRVPILPNNYHFRSSPEALHDDKPVMKPEISTMSADAVYLPMADMHDGHAMNVDFHAMADKVAANLKRMQLPVEEQAGMLKQLWNDIVDDMMAIAQQKKTS